VAVGLGTASLALASAQKQNRSGHDGVELTFKKWNSPTGSSPTFAGVVGGDIVGQFGGAVLDVKPDASGPFVHITAVYIIIAPDPTQSLTMHIDGALDTRTGHAVFSGRVVDGWLDNSKVHVEWDAISCTEAPSGTCFQGTASIK
jgi:hypothetical protein